MRRRTLILMIAVGPGIATAAWLAAVPVGEQGFRAEVHRAQSEYAARRYDEAAARLARLAAQRPGQGEVEFWLGVCAQARGRIQDALAAWGRVPDAAAEAPTAAVRRARLALEHGHYAIAEESLARASRLPGGWGDETEELGIRLAWRSGRPDDARDLLRKKLGRSRAPAEVLRNLWTMDRGAFPSEGIRGLLEKAAREAPDDDRVWLGRADLAIRSGRLDEAEAWLRRCEARRPGDAAVGLARLAWARAAGRPEAALRASAHLPASLVPPARVLALRAWFAARGNDRAAERKALDEWIAREPADAAALERRAEVAAEEGDAALVSDLRRRKAAVDAALERYQALIDLPDPTSRAAELAGAAEALGRRFDARAWWDLAARRDPTPEARDALARLAGDAPKIDPGARTLADLLAPLRPPGGWKEAPAGDLIVPSFADDAGRQGLSFTFDNGRTDLRQMPEALSGGVGVLDFDGDGQLDVYAVQGGPFPPPTSPAPFSDRLFRNAGGGRFEDATASSGLAAMAGGYGHGVAVGDYDNDGRPDLFVTRWQSYALYRNNGDGTFVDVTDAAGLGGDRDWPTSAAWADLDGDGDLDLYVCHYLKWDPVTSAPCNHPSRPVNTYCSPRDYPALPDHVFRNDGGRFRDVTGEAGIVDRDGRGLGVVAADLDGDGKTDLFVANDTSANFFFRNLGGFRFAEEGLESGLATNAEGGYLAGMGVACGDLDGDGRPDLAVTNFFGESTTVYHNFGGGQFADWSAVTGLAASTRLKLGFGLAALDANNDGRLDLVQANGHVDDYRPAAPYAMPAQLFLGDAAGRLVDASDREGDPWQVPRLGRGLAVGDLDNDGHPDVLLVAENAPLALLHNRPSARNHFLTLSLCGTASNRDAVGARVAVTASGRTQIGLRIGGGSYLSASDPRLHFGLGSARAVERVEVSWPSGRSDRYEGLQSDAAYRLREGDPVPQPLPGFPPVPGTPP